MQQSTLSTFPQGKKIAIYKEKAILKMLLCPNLQNNTNQGNIISLRLFIPFGVGI